MFCNKCGQALDDSAMFCSRCGSPVNNASANTTPGQNQIVEQKSKPHNPNKKTIIFIAIISAILIVCLLIFCLIKLLGRDDNVYEKAEGTTQEETTNDTEEAPTTSWEELYNLGEEYLLAQKYDKAIATFTESIKIDPNQAVTYIGRGKAYVLSGETAENLSAAEKDYEKAIALDKTIVDAWIGLAEIYMCRSDYDAALDVLHDAQEQIGDIPDIMALIEEINAAKRIESAEYTIEQQDLSYYTANGDPLIILTYDLVILLGDYPSFEKINEKIYEKYEQFYGDEGREGFKEFLDGPYLSPESPYLDTGEAGVSYNDHGIISIVIVQDWYMGGVYNHLYDSMTYDLNTGDTLEIADLISMEEAELTDILQRITKIFILDSGYETFDNALDTVDNYSLDDFKFFVEDGEIILYFNEYILGPGASGSITIPTGLIIEGSEDIPGAADYLPADYAGMTVNELTSLWGKHYLYDYGWLTGAAKPIFYTDRRTPLIFYFLDDDHDNYAKGDEIIAVIEYYPESGDGIDYITEDLPSSATYSQLHSLDLDGVFYDGDDFFQEFGETALFSIQYSDTLRIEYLWFLGDDPYTTEAECIHVHYSK